MGNAGRRDQTFGVAFGRCEGGAIRLHHPGDRDVHQTDRTAAIANCLKQARDEITMHGICVAAGPVLEHAEAVHDDIDGMLAEHSRQRSRIQDEDRQLDVQRAHLLRRRQLTCHAYNAKATRTQIVGDEAADQAGGAEQQDGSLTHCAPHNGFAIISQRISIVAPKPGKPNMNQRRNRTK